VAYNFIYSLGQHSYDADCNLFLRVFTGDVEETVRYEQQALEGEIMRWGKGHSGAVSQPHDAAVVRPSLGCLKQSACWL
jgi:hypothetical protein